MHLLVPTIVDRVADMIEILSGNRANEKDLDIVLDGNQFRVVDPRLFGKLLALRVDVKSYGGESEFGFVLKKPRLLSCHIYDTMLGRSHTFL